MDDSQCCASMTSCQAVSCSAFECLPVGTIALQAVITYVRRDALDVRRALMHMCNSISNTQPTPYRLGVNHPEHPPANCEYPSACTTLYPVYPVEIIPMCAVCRWLAGTVLCRGHGSSDV